jgi:transposase
MSAPGVGVVAALAYMTGVEDPARFQRLSSVAAHFGMTPRRYQSGESITPGVSPSAETAWCAASYSRP